MIYSVDLGELLSERFRVTRSHQCQDKYDESDYGVPLLLTFNVYMGRMSLMRARWYESVYGRILSIWGSCVVWVLSS